MGIKGKRKNKGKLEIKKAKKENFGENFQNSEIPPDFSFIHMRESVSLTTA